MIFETLSAFVMGGVACRMATLRKPIFVRSVHQQTWRQRAASLLSSFWAWCDWLMWVLAHASIGAGALLVFMDRRDDWAAGLLVGGNAIYFTLRWARKAVS